MPAGVVKTKQDEKLWERAKAIVRKQYPSVPADSDRFYALVMGVYKKMHGGELHKAHPGTIRATDLVKSVTDDYEAESEQIRRNQQTRVAQRRHRFRRARWTHPNGHPRCLLCGEEEPVGGICEGAPMRKAGGLPEPPPKGARTAAQKPTANAVREAALILRRRYPELRHRVSRHVQRFGRLSDPAVGAFSLAIRAAESWERFEHVLRGQKREPMKTVVRALGSVPSLAALVNNVTRGSRVLAKATGSSIAERYRDAVFEERGDVDKMQAIRARILGRQAERERKLAELLADSPEGVVRIKPDDDHPHEGWVLVIERRAGPEGFRAIRFCGGSVTQELAETPGEALSAALGIGDWERAVPSTPKAFLEASQDQEFREANRRAALQQQAARIKQLAADAATADDWRGKESLYEEAIAALYERELDDAERSVREALRAAEPIMTKALTLLRSGFRRMSPAEVTILGAPQGVPVPSLAGGSWTVDGKGQVGYTAPPSRSRIVVKAAAQQPTPRPARAEGPLTQDAGKAAFMQQKPEERERFAPAMRKLASEGSEEQRAYAAGWLDEALKAGLAKDERSAREEPSPVGEPERKRAGGDLSLVSCTLHVDGPDSPGEAVRLVKHPDRARLLEGSSGGSRQDPRVGQCASRTGGKT